MGFQLINTEHQLKQSVDDITHTLEDLDILKLSSHFLFFGKEEETILWFVQTY